MDELVYVEHIWMSWYMSSIYELVYELVYVEHIWMSWYMLNGDEWRRVSVGRPSSALSSRPPIGVEKGTTPEAFMESIMSGGTNIAERDLFLSSWKMPDHHTVYTGSKVACPHCASLWIPVIPTYPYSGGTKRM